MALAAAQRPDEFGLSLAQPGGRGKALRDGRSAGRLKAGRLSANYGSGAPPEPDASGRSGGKS